MDPFLRVTSRSKKEERNWRGKSTFPEAEILVSQMVVDRKLKNVLQELQPLEKQGKVEGFFTNAKNSDKLAGLVENI